MLQFYQRAFSLIELIIAVAITGIVLAAGMPAFTKWIQSVQIRSAAQSLEDGIQLARTEAVRQNKVIHFYLTDNVTMGCTLTANGTSWVVSMNSPAGACATAPVTMGGALTPTAVNIFQVHDSTKEGSSSIQVKSVTGVDDLSFDGLGKMVGIATAGGASVTVAGAVTLCIASSSLADNSTCTTSTGSSATSTNGEQLSLIVQPGGQIRLCDGALNGTNDPQACI